MKRELQPEQMRKNVSEAKNLQYAGILAEMIRCRTVYTPDGKYAAEFQRFYEIVTRSFPLLSARAKRLEFGTGCFVYVIEGENAAANVMLMSHHDVVDAGEGWTVDPFGGEIRDGAIFGRGAVDTKGSLFAILQACESLLEEGYTFPGINLYLGSSNNEEVSGDGMVLATQYFAENGIHFDVVLDEGGAITSGLIPGFGGKSAMVAVHEKGRHMYRCVAKQAEQGHVSLNPSDDSAILRMGAFMNEVSAAKIFRGQFYPEVRGTFQQHAPYMSFPMNVLFGNLGLFSPVIKAIMLKLPQTKAMLSTSVAFTTIHGGDAPYMKAKEVDATMYLRCIREADLEKGMEKIQKIAQKYDISIELTNRDYCTPSDFDSKPCRILRQVLQENFPDVVVAPFLLTAGTDARRFTDVADSILRFAPVDLDRKQYASIHSADENLTVSNLGQCVCFYRDFVKAYAESL